MARPVQPLRAPLTDAQRALVEAHLEFARSGARKYFTINRRSGRGRFTLAELESAAYWGLVRAAQTFEPRRGFTFKTYAFNWCEHVLRREWQTDLRQMRGFRWPDTHKGERGMVKVVQEAPWPHDKDTGELFDVPTDPGDPAGDEWRQHGRELAARACRDDRDRRILAGLLAEETWDEIGKAIGFSRGFVYLRREAIIRRAKLIAAGYLPNSRADRLPRMVDGRVTHTKVQSDDRNDAKR